MAIQTIAGSVENLVVAEQNGVTYGLVTVFDAQSTQVNFLVWSDDIEDYSPTQRLKHGNWMALLREALIHSKRVEVSFDPNVNFALIAVSLGTLPASKWSGDKSVLATQVKLP